MPINLHGSTTCDQQYNLNTKSTSLNNVTFIFKIGPFPASFSFIFVFSIQYKSTYKFCDDWIRTADLWCQKQPLYQLRHNHFPTFICKDILIRRFRIFLAFEVKECCDRGKSFKFNIYSIRDISDLLTVEKGAKIIFFEDFFHTEEESHSSKPLSFSHSLSIFLFVLLLCSCNNWNKALFRLKSVYSTELQRNHNSSCMANWSC